MYGKLHERVKGINVVPALREHRDDWTSILERTITGLRAVRIMHTEPQVRLWDTPRCPCPPTRGKKCQDS